MTKLHTLKAAEAGDGVQSRMPAERILAGDPVFTAWAMQTGDISSGIWSSTEGKQMMARDAQTWEFFHILEGEVELTDDQGNATRFGPGDSCIVPPGFTGSWHTIRAVRKSYVTIRSAGLPALLGA